MKSLIQFLKDTKGATAIEYGLIAALISVAVIGGMTSLGSGTNELYGTLESEIRPKL